MQYAPGESWVGAEQKKKKTSAERNDFSPEGQKNSEDMRLSGKKETIFIPDL